MNNDSDNNINIDNDNYSMFNNNNSNNNDNNGVSTCARLVQQGTEFDESRCSPPGVPDKSDTPSFRTKTLDFRGFDSSIILDLRGGIIISIGNFPEMLSQQILVGMILVGRLGV